MTDDLQRAKLDTETPCRHLADGFLLGSTDHTGGTVALLPVLLLLLRFGSRFLTADFLARLGDPLRLTRFAALRPVTPRPPPAALLLA